MHKDEISKSENKYQDIIHLPHHQSNVRKRMPIEDRAAQFAPFAALTGHKEEVEEAGRYVDAKIEIDESIREKLNKGLLQVKEGIASGRSIKFLYFQADGRKEGGAYVEKVGAVKKVDEYTGEVIFVDGSKIAMEDILEIENVE